MKKDFNQLASISDVHRLLGLPKPVHPMISLMDATEGNIDMNRMPDSYVMNFYKITIITKLGGKIKYGQGYYDFAEGSMIFAAPHQVMGGTGSYQHNFGYALLIHPDFFKGHPLAQKLKRYNFFSYATREALHLSDQEKSIILSIYNIIRDELESRIDEFSREVLIAQIELLLTYANRFYKRQFITREPVSNELLPQLEKLLNDYFDEDQHIQAGVPTVQYLADKLNFSPNYLSDMLRSLTGFNAQQHIHRKLIEVSKELLSTTNMTVGEVAYQLGFEHPQSFSRLFKLKTNQSPVEYRASFNQIY